jgi:hypothetical protein
MSPNIKAGKQWTEKTTFRGAGCGINAVPSCYSLPKWEQNTIMG